MTMCKRERPEMIFKPSMGLLEDVDVRVTDLNNTANHLTIKHLEHEQTHEKYKEWLRRNDINYKILEIRQLCGFSKKSCRKKWIKNYIETCLPFLILVYYLPC